MESLYASVSMVIPAITLVVVRILTNVLQESWDYSLRITLEAAIAQRKGTHNCDKMAKCQNTEGYWKCTCLVGYSGEGYNGTCEDIDECSRPDVCEANSKCINTDGGYICECDQGYWQWAFS